MKPAALHVQPGVITFHSDTLTPHYPSIRHRSKTICGLLFVAIVPVRVRGFVIIVLLASELNDARMGCAMRWENATEALALHVNFGGIIYRLTRAAPSGRGRHIKELNHMFGWSLI